MSIKTTLSPRWTWPHSVAVALTLLLLLLTTASLVPWPLVAGRPASALMTWVFLIALLAAFLVIIGHGVTGRYLGILIGARNRMSLARLQFVMWTVPILSAWLTAVLWNLAHGVAEPLNITIPTQVWLLLGISTTSLVGTPLVLSAKTDRQPNWDQMTQQLERANAQRGGAPWAPAETQAARVDAMMTDLRLERHGVVIGHEAPAEASLGDLFKGDEVGNFVQLDLSKVQMFYFTLILALAYAAALGAMFQTARADGITALPSLSDSAVALLGISQAGYLTYKAVPHSAPPQPGG